LARLNPAQRRGGVAPDSADDKLQETATASLGKQLAVSGGPNAKPDKKEATRRWGP